MPFPVRREPGAPGLHRLRLGLIRAGRVKHVMVVDVIDDGQVPLARDADPNVCHRIHPNPGRPSRVNRPSTLILTPSTSTYPPWRRSTTMSQCKPDWLLLPLSG